MHAGLMFGLGESTAGLISGVVCKYVKDSTAFTFFMLLAGTA
jgi:hypothetical protein